METTSIDQVKIIDFEERYTKEFADLNYEWISHFFKVEPIDRKYLDNPQTMIVDNGGAIQLAKYGDEIVGTIALVSMGNDIYELAKMSVNPKLRGKKIGHKLMDACLKKAKEFEAKMVIILSNRKLENAIHLYKKYGFIDVGNEDDDYERCNIRMELIFSS